MFILFNLGAPDSSLFILLRQLYCGLYGSCYLKRLHQTILKCHVFPVKESKFYLKWSPGKTHFGKIHICLQYFSQKSNQRTEKNPKKCCLESCPPICNAFHPCFCSDMGCHDCHSLLMRFWGLILKAFLKISVIWASCLHWLLLISFWHS